MLEGKIQTLLEPVISEMGYILWGCQIIGSANNALLRIYIENDENGINLKDCERVSRQVSAVLDVEDPIPGQYQLEISSPGIDRPLFYNWQYKRYLDKKIRVTLVRAIEGRRKFVGTIVDVTDKQLQLLVDGEQISMVFSDISKANLIA